MDTRQEKTEQTDSGLADEVMRGLKAPDKSLPSKLFYDRRGSELFERICRQEEYYLTGKEMEIMERHVSGISEELGSGVVLIEFGSGSSYKTRLLLDHLAGMKAYIPVDISEEFLAVTAEKLGKEYPGLDILPVAADYTQPFNLPEAAGSGRKIIYFPGSTIGNFTPEHARHFLRRTAVLAGENGGLLIGVDLAKDRKTLEAAYNDKEQVTAAFNRNILHRLNRELDAGFDPGEFDHLAFFNEGRSRMEMHLVSRKDQTVYLSGEPVRFRKGESVHTENSYKFTTEGFLGLAAGSFRPGRIWKDESGWFAVFFLRPRPELFS